MKTPENKLKNNINVTIKKIKNKLKLLDIIYITHT